MIAVLFTSDAIQATGEGRYSVLVANLVLAGLVMIWPLRFVFSGDMPRFALVGTLAVTILFG